MFIVSSETRTIHVSYSPRNGHKFEKSCNNQIAQWAIIKVHLLKEFSSKISPKAPFPKSNVEMQKSDGISFLTLSVQKIYGAFVCISLIWRFQ